MGTFALGEQKGRGEVWPDRLCWEGYAQIEADETDFVKWDAAWWAVAAAFVEWGRWARERHATYRQLSRKAITDLVRRVGGEGMGLNRVTAYQRFQRRFWLYFPAFHASDYELLNPPPRIRRDASLLPDAAWVWVDGEPSGVRRVRPRPSLDVYDEPGASEIQHIAAMRRDQAGDEP